jgi:DNA-binding protein HU-beta
LAANCACIVWKGWPNPQDTAKTVAPTPRIGSSHDQTAKHEAGQGLVEASRDLDAKQPGATMSKAFIASVIQESAELTGAAANRAAGDLMEAIVRELKKSGKFTLPSFGTFTVRKTKARKGLNPRTGEAIKVKAGKTVRFKASPTLKKAV